jgi:hypothetical protein
MCVSGKTAVDFDCRKNSTASLAFLFAAFNKGQGGHGLPFSAISCRFTP